MKIRSITTLLNPGWPLEAALLNQSGKFNSAAQKAYTEAGFEVQTTRLATTPFPRVAPGESKAGILRFARTLEAASIQNGYGYLNIGPAFPENLEHYALLPDLFAETETVFAAGMIASPETGISLPAIRASADVIARCTLLEPTGFGNLYFAALANVPPGGPFFPAAYHDGGEPSFAIATEAADLAVQAFSQADSLQDARDRLIQSLETHASRLAVVGKRLEDAFGFRFGGIDFTMAPFPEKSKSIGTAFEALGVPAVGMHGSLAAAAFLMDALDRAVFQRAGFCGLMLPVLEDAVLAARSSERHLSVPDLLLYASVCGTGLDTVPLPGDTSQEALVGVLLDIASLAQRLDKPLTARLLPVPGKSAGEPTTFDFPFFKNGRVMELKSTSLGGVFNGTENFSLKPRQK